MPATPRHPRRAAASALLSAPARGATTLPFDDDPPACGADLHRLQALVAGLQSGIVVEDEAGRIVLANDEVCDLLDIHADAQALIGADCLAMMRECALLTCDAEAFLLLVADVREARAAVRDVRIELLDGRSLACDYMPIWGTERYAGHLWMYRDVSPQVRAEAELQAARDAALAAASAKEEFLAAMSHEIRTPMNGIVATAELLATSALDPEQRKLVDMVAESAQTLRALLDDVLDLSKIEAGRIDLEVRPLDLVALVEGTVGLSAADAAARGLTLAVDVAPGVPRHVVGDAARLRQVVANLVSNAVKFTERGGVDVRMTAEPEGVVCLEVADTGIGISAAALGRIFDPFTQADSSTTRRYGGTGLGLAIVRRLAQRMGGTIDAASAPGAGSRFVVRLPLEEAAGELPRGTAPRGDEPPLSGRVLLAEDLDINRAVILRQLARLGLAADAVGDGREAVAAVERDDYALVLMDCRMPRMDGLDATRAIRALPGARADVPIVALTASALVADREACAAAGMDAYVSKPVLLAELRAALAPFLGPTPRDGVMPDGPAAAVEPGSVMELAGELASEAMAMALVMAYLRALPGRAEAIRAAGSAGDHRALADAAHALKSPSAMFGAGALAATCQALEDAGAAADRERTRTALHGLDAAVAATDAALRAQLAAVGQASGASTR